MTMMRANVFQAKNKFQMMEVPRPKVGYGEALIRITLTTICGTDLHIVRGEYPVRPGLTIGHEPVGIIEEIGPGVAGYHVGDRVSSRSHHTMWTMCGLLIWASGTMRTWCWI